MLTPTEITQLTTLVTREGGLQAFIAEIQDINVTNLKAAALATLTPAITVTVQNWPALTAYVAGSSNATMYAVMADITAAATAHDATKLGPLFVQLYAAVKA